MNFEQNHHSLQRNALPPILFSLLSLFLKFNLCKIQILLNYKYLSIITGSVIGKVWSLLLKQIIKKKKSMEEGGDMGLTKDMGLEGRQEEEREVQ